VQRHVVAIGATAVSARDPMPCWHWLTRDTSGGNIKPRDVLDYPGWPGLWKLCARHWLTGVDEVIRTLFRERFLARNARTGAGNP
jgi:hypothetical protein